jgi:hypothetical protein
LAEKKRSGFIPMGQPIPEMQKVEGEAGKEKGQSVPPMQPVREREDATDEGGNSNQGRTGSETGVDDNQ